MPSSPVPHLVLSPSLACGSRSGPGPSCCGRSVQDAAGTERFISNEILPFDSQSSAVSSRSRHCGEGGSPYAWKQYCARSLSSRVSVLMYASKPPAVSRPSSCATTTTRQPCRAGPDPAPCGHLRVPESHHLSELPRLLQIEVCLVRRAGTLTVRRIERRAQKEVVGMPTLSLLDDACGRWESQNARGGSVGPWMTSRLEP